jgi:hypothetical protein
MTGTWTFLCAPALLTSNTSFAMLRAAPGVIYWQINPYPNKVPLPYTGHSAHVGEMDIQQFARF